MAHTEAVHKGGGWEKRRANQRRKKRSQGVVRARSGQSQDPGKRKHRMEEEAENGKRKSQNLKSESRKSERVRVRIQGSGI